MELVKRGKVWVAKSSYDERSIPKAAGFWWHGGNCRSNCAACASGVSLRVWFTPFREKALKLAAYASGETRDELEAEAKAKAERLQASMALDSDAVIPAPEGLEYRPFQRAGIAACRNNTSMIIGDEMGLGKTIQAIGVYNDDPSIHHVLIICPATLRLNWKREFERWQVREESVGVVTGGKEKDWPGTDVIIINFDILKKHHEALRSRNWDLLIVDEAHYCKEPKSQRTQQIMGFVPPTRGTNKDKPAIPAIPAKRRLLLTGTPIINRPKELHPLISYVAPEEFPPNRFFGFAKRYCDAKQERFGWNFDGASNLDELHERLRATCLIRRLKKDVLTELPPKTRQVIEMPANGASKAVKDELEAYARLQEDVEALKVRVEQARETKNSDEYAEAVKALKHGMGAAFTSMATVRREVAEKKAKHVIAFLEDAVESSGKVIFFAHHKAMISQVVDAFGDACVSITGDTPQMARQGIVDRFQNDESVKLFVGSIRACSEGITLTAASHVIFGELDWTPAKVSQAEDRAHRIGQTETVLVQHLVLEGSLDALMARALVEKQEVIDAALDADLPTQIEPVLPEVATQQRNREGVKVKMEGILPGRYAVDADEGHTAFYKIDRSERGWWFVMLQAGPEFSRLGAVTPEGKCRDGRVAKILKKIARDPKAAAIRYGLELGVCSRCGRELTNEDSRTSGIGPICAAKVGW